PVYVAGRDSDGSADGVTSYSLNSLTIKNNYLFVGKKGSSTPCSQIPGSALGCELQVYSFATFLNHSTTFNIKTNSQSGYSATLNFSSTTALQRTNGEGYINNYLPQSSTTPDYTFNPPTT